MFMNRYTYPLAVMFLISLFSSCTNNDNETSQTYEYCVYSADKFCADGPFTKCQENGRLSNTCPYPSGSSPSLVSSSSSATVVVSSSSIPLGASSSSSKPNSSSGSRVVSSSSIQSGVSSSSSKQSNSSSSSHGSSAVAVPSSSSEPTQSRIIFGPSVTYEGETYQTVVIGTQTWFKRNLNYAVSGSVCYGNDPDNCAKFGRLYNWETAMVACPKFY